MLAFRITLVAAFVALTAAAEAGLPRRGRLLENRILGGENADIKDLPYQVSLHHYTRHLCGASVISDKFALTAAHCITDKNIGPLTGYIAAGSSQHDNGERYYLANAKVHEKYSDDSFDYDIGLLEVARTFQFGPTVKPIALPEANENTPDNTEVTVSGWGALGFASPDPDVLQKVKVKVVSRSTCIAALSYDGVTDRMICAAAEDKNVCSGDFGSPLVANDKQIGIVSWGKSVFCDPGDVAVYAKVSNPELREFIKNNANV